MKTALEGWQLWAVLSAVFAALTAIFAKLGLQNGDTIQAINGTSVSSADSALDVYVQLRDAKELQVSLLRRGSVITLFYTIR